MSSLNEKQLEKLSSLIGIGAEEASRALSTWLGRKVNVQVEQLREVSLESAVEQLGPIAEIACACCMRVTGELSGQLLFGFDDSSGLILCDTLLNREAASKAWGELEISSAMETTNIVGCAFLNSLADIFPKREPHSDPNQNSMESTWIPSPPIFIRDFAAAIMQFALLDQASEFDSVLVAQTKFTIDATPIRWQLLLIPDANVLVHLAETLV
jgi:chemotaxis protein CheC